MRALCMNEYDRNIVSLLSKLFNPIYLSALVNPTLRRGKNAATRKWKEKGGGKGASSSSSSLLLLAVGCCCWGGGGEREGEWFGLAV